MIINGTDNQQFELKVLGYEFPDATEYWDANRLNIHFEYRSDNEHWQYTDPSFMTGDVESIVEWFSQLSENSKTAKNSLRVMDTNLYFKRLTQFDSPFNRIRVVHGKFSMNFEYDNPSLKLIANELADELSEFPWRGVEENYDEK